MWKIISPQSKVLTMIAYLKFHFFHICPYFLHIRDPSYALTYIPKHPCTKAWFNSRSVARGVWWTTPNLQKGPLLVKKLVKMGFLYEGLGGWGSKSSLFGTRRSTFWGSCTSPKLILATRLMVSAKEPNIFSLNYIMSGHKLIQEGVSLNKSGKSWFLSFIGVLDH